MDMGPLDAKDIAELESEFLWYTAAGDRIRCSLCTHRICDAVQEHLSRLAGLVVSNKKPIRIRPSSVGPEGRGALEGLRTRLWRVLAASALDARRRFEDAGAPAELLHAAASIQVVQQLLVAKDGILNVHMWRQVCRHALQALIPTAVALGVTCRALADFLASAHAAFPQDEPTGSLQAVEATVWVVLHNLQSAKLQQLCLEVDKPQSSDYLRGVLLQRRHAHCTSTIGDAGAAKQALAGAGAASPGAAFICWLCEHDAVPGQFKAAAQSGHGAVVQQVANASTSELEHLWNLSARVGHPALGADGIDLADEAADEDLFFIDVPAWGGTTCVWDESDDDDSRDGPEGSDAHAVDQ